MTNELANFWSSYSDDGIVLAHHADEQILLSNRYKNLLNPSVNNFEDYIHKYQSSQISDDKIHLSLLPGPYQGDLDNADIILLLLNPGFCHTDYYVEFNDKSFYKAKLDTINQKNRKFTALDSKYCWTAGYAWWERKLKDVLLALAEQKYDNDYASAIAEIRQKISCIELFPYHSSRFGASKLIKELPSCKIAIDHVHTQILPQVLARNRLLGCGLN
ncbi:hypothetical protein [Parvularcula sp. IMCC14364]|uniref:hypothetical protein n=1 Tax=Parvularcula sp. IMCC14364 TaxID=3067902 RepID=UPI0027426699|nr:hypothetical protein [Parvularcula sp. IMCC14364]